MIDKTNLFAKAAKIKLVIFDVDGVLTDGSLYFGETGEEYKVFNVHDGLGFKLLQSTGVIIAVISSRKSKMVNDRLQNLGVKYIYQGQEHKKAAFDELLATLQLQPTEVAYVGDDLPDLALIQQVGLGICVANAHPLLKQHAAWQTEARGGHGAAREVCELIMAAQETLPAVYQQYLLA